MNTIYAPGVRWTDQFGGRWDIGNTSDPSTVVVRTTGVWRPKDRFAEWAERQKVWDVATAFSVSAPNPTPKAEQPVAGNKEREKVFRVVTALEKAIAELPQGHAQVAGFLMAKGFKGDTTPDGNALALYLADAVRQRLLKEAPDIALTLPHVNIWVEANGTIVESPRYQVALDPQPWQDMFINLLRKHYCGALIR